MGSVALDANVVIGMLDPADAHHEPAVALLRRHEHDRPIISSVAYAEVMVRAVRDGDVESVDRAIDRAGVEVVPLDRATARRAAALRGEHRSLRVPDALVLATAQEHDAKLLTFDKRLSRLA